MKTIVHVIDTGGPGGAETLFARLAVGLQDTAVRSIAIVGREGWLAEHLRHRQLEPLIVPSSGSLNVQYLLELLRILRRERADALLTHLYGPAVYGAMAGALSGTPVVSVIHGQSDVESEGRFARLKSAIVRHRTDRLIFVSDQLNADITRRLRLNDSQCKVILNGIDLSEFAPRSNRELRDALRLDDSDILIGAIGNIRPPKAYDVLLDATRILCDHSDRIHVAIAGEGTGDLMNALIAQRDRLGLANRVHFLGFRGDAGRVLNNLDVFVICSRTEGFSLACVEAMASGIPVVATRSGGPESIVVHGESGLLVPAGSPSDLAAAIRTLLDDRELRSRLRDAARRRVISAFSEKRMLEEYRAVLTEVMSR